MPVGVPIPDPGVDRWGGVVQRDPFYDVSWKKEPFLDPSRVVGSNLFVVPGIVPKEPIVVNTKTRCQSEIKILLRLVLSLRPIIDAIRDRGQVTGS